MPRSAIATGLADVVAAPSEMPEKHPRRSPRAAPDSVLPTIADSPDELC